MEWTPERIRTLLAANNAAVQRALLVLDARQTPDERAGRRTDYLNGKGWNRFDAPLMSGFAASVRAGRNLLDSEMRQARYRLNKYAKQLTAHANANVAAKAAAVAAVTPVEIVVTETAPADIYRF